MPVSLPKSPAMLLVSAWAPVPEEPLTSMTPNTQARQSGHNQQVYGRRMVAKMLELHLSLNMTIVSYYSVIELLHGRLLVVRHLPRALLLARRRKGQRAPIVVFVFLPPTSGEQGRGSA